MFYKNLKEQKTANSTYKLQVQNEDTNELETYTVNVTGSKSGSKRNLEDVDPLAAEQATSRPRHNQPTATASNIFNDYQDERLRETAEDSYNEVKRQFYSGILDGPLNDEPRGGHQYDQGSPDDRASDPIRSPSHHSATAPTVINNTGGSRDRARSKTFDTTVREYEEPYWAEIPQDAMSWYFSVLDGGTEVDTVRLRGDKSHIVVGRAPNCDYVLKHPSASRVHCIVQHGLGTLFLYDLSVHNTYVNGKAIEKKYFTPISAGDHVQFGGDNSEYVLRMGSSEMVARPPKVETKLSARPNDNGLTATGEYDEFRRRLQDLSFDVEPQNVRQVYDSVLASAQFHDMDDFLNVLAKKKKYDKEVTRMKKLATSNSADAMGARLELARVLLDSDRTEVNNRLASIGDFVDFSHSSDSSPQGRHDLVGMNQTVLLSPREAPAGGAGGQQTITPKPHTLPFNRDASDDLPVSDYDDMLLAGEPQGDDNTMAPHSLRTRRLSTFADDVSRIDRSYNNQVEDVFNNIALGHTDFESTDDFLDAISKKKRFDDDVILTRKKAEAGGSDAVSARLELARLLLDTERTELNNKIKLASTSMKAW